MQKRLDLMCVVHFPLNVSSCDAVFLPVNLHDWWLIRTTPSVYWTNTVNQCKCCPGLKSRTWYCSLLTVWLIRELQVYQTEIKPIYWAPLLYINIMHTLCTCAAWRVKQSSALWEIACLLFNNACLLFNKVILMTECTKQRWCHTVIPYGNLIPDHIWTCILNYS